MKSRNIASHNYLGYLKRAYKKLPNWSRFIIAAASTVTAIIFFYHLAITVYSATFGQKHIAYTKISSLTADAQISYFNAILGQPVFKNKFDGWTEYIYVEKYMYIQALTDSDGVVRLYAITTRSKSFNPEIVRYSYTANPSNLHNIIKKKILVKLGKTTLDEVSNMYGGPEGIRAESGVRRYFYDESYYEGNPGNYQEYIFGLNDAGYFKIDGEYYEGQKALGSFQALPAGHSSLNQLSIEDGTLYKFNKERDEKLASTLKSDTKLDSFRKHATVNTFAITSPNFSVKYDLSKIPIGADLDQVRVLETLRAP